MTAPTYLHLRDDPDNFRTYYTNRRGKVFCIAPEKRWVAGKKKYETGPALYECTDEGEPLWAMTQFPQDHEFDTKVTP